MSKKQEKTLKYNQNILTIEEHPYLSVLYGFNYEDIGGTKETDAEKELIKQD